VDRKKELIINAAGKNMSPTNIEMAIRSAGNMIAHVCVVGDARPYNVALIVVDPTTTGPLNADDPSLHPRVREQIERANITLARVEQIKKFLILPQEWRNGIEFTPTGKLRRRVITEMYASEIEDLYSSATEFSWPK
jgi:long-chain acyl-CoA synthetase